jgi:hypothetical protein
MPDDQLEIPGVQEDTPPPTASEPEAELPLGRLSHAQALIVRVPLRDWTPLSEWVGTSALATVEEAMRGTHSLAVLEFDLSSEKPVVAIIAKEGTEGTIEFLATGHRSRYRAASALSQLLLRNCNATR